MEKEQKKITIQKALGKYADRDVKRPKKFPTPKMGGYFVSEAKKLKEMMR